jgi:hypothetical protein
MSYYINTISQLSRRGLVAELDDALAEVVQHVRTNGKPGKITLELVIRPRDADVSSVDVIENVKVSLPPKKRLGSIFFPLEDGTLSRTDPAQQEMDLRSIEGGKSDETQPAAAKSAVG